MRRRDFLATSAAASAALAAPAPLFASRDKPLRVGLIGTGWYGKCDLLRLMQVTPVEVVALCDPDKRMLDGAEKIIGERKGFTKAPRKHADYRELLKEKDCEVVIVGTPDHWHALPAIAAIQSGADVWVQKPVSVDVLEGKAMVDAARKHGKVVQVGTQRRSTPHLVEAKQKVADAGLLGTVGSVEVYCYYHMRNPATPPVTQPPDYFDYDLWTGPAPLRPYDCPKYNGGDPLPHRGWWRAFMEYGNGIVGDMCIHMLDLVRWQLNLGWPTRVDSAGGIRVQKQARSNISDTQTATFDFDGLPVVWNHRTYGAPADPEYPWGATIYGDKGTLKLSVHKYEFFPTGKKEPTLTGKAYTEEDKFPEDKTEKDLERHVAVAIRDHWKDFLKARAGRAKPVADIEQGHISTASCILANLSMELGRSLTWDPAKHVVVNDADATKRLKREYRKPWTHPADAG
jgi:predicted dehydrogenase